MKAMLSIMIMIVMITGCEKKKLLRILDNPGEQAPVPAEGATTDAAAEVGEKPAIPNIQPEKGFIEDRAAKAGFGFYRQAVAAVREGDPAKAQELYLASCQNGYLPGCHRYGWHQQQEGNWKNASNFYKRSCEGGYWKSCNNLGWYAEKNGLQNEAQNFYSWACLKGHPGSCKNLRRVEEKARLAH